MKMKKIFSLVLTFVCVLSTLSVSADACDDAECSDEDYILYLTGMDDSVYRYNPIPYECPICKGYLVEKTGYVLNVNAATKCPENTSGAHVPFEAGTYMFCNACSILSYWIEKVSYGVICTANIAGHGYI